MISQITAGIEVRVETSYQPAFSQPALHNYAFSYKIHIVNHNDFVVQLISRKWIIKNGFGEIDVVEGDGVVGRQPVLYAGDSYEYVSGCHLISTIGTMEGIYFFENKQTNEIISAIIPLFKLEAIEALN